MAKFDAGTAVSKLEYTFEAFGGSKGCIPEPEDHDVEELFDTLATLMPEGSNSEEDIIEALQNDEFSMREINETMQAAVVKLCKGSPSEDDIGGLPYRVKTKFFNWLLQEITDPEDGGAATKSTRKVRRGA